MLSTKRASWVEKPGTSSDRRWRNPSHAKSSAPDRARPSGRCHSSSSTGPSSSSRASGKKYSMPREELAIELVDEGAHRLDVIVSEGQRVLERDLGRLECLAIHIAPCPH